MHPIAPPIAFVLPWLQLPIYWYGVCFAVGVCGSLALYNNLLLRQHLSSEQRRTHIDLLLPTALSCILLGARALEVIAYSPHLARSWELFINLRLGGLSSHGGVIGALIAPYILRKHLTLSYLKTVDTLALSAFPLLLSIRIGNFINGELIGKVTSWPLTVQYLPLYVKKLINYLYTSPSASAQLFRHPAVLYEAATYTLIGVMMLAVAWKTRYRSRPGTFAMMTISLMLSARFILENFKEEASLLLPEGIKYGAHWLNTAQILTLGLFIFLLILVTVVLLKPSSTGRRHDSWQQ